MESSRYYCRKTYTNGRDDEVKETFFCLTIVEDKNTGKFRVVNLTDNTIWDKEYNTINVAVLAITGGPWTVIEVREPVKAYTFNQYQKEHQYDIPNKANYLAEKYPTITWVEAQQIYAYAVAKVLSDANEEYIDAGSLSWGRGRVKVMKEFEDGLRTWSI